jgi:hypothetical protein
LSGQHTIGIKTRNLTSGARFLYSYLSDEALSDIDHLLEITDKAYLYYLPAFLIATLNRPSGLVFYSFPFAKISGLRSRFSPEQLEVLIDYFELIINLWQYPEFNDPHFVASAEDAQLRLMIWRDEL